MNIVITSATALEQSLIAQKIEEAGSWENVTFHTSGVGIMQATWSLAKLFHTQKPDLIIQCGIAGSFDEEDDFGKVYLIESDCCGSLGVEEEGVWKDIFDNGFADEDHFPFSRKMLVNPWCDKLNVISLPLAPAVTVDEITTRFPRVQMLKKKYGAKLESMEGAPFHYACLQNNVPFLQVRAVSNKVGVRDKSQWHIKFALENVSQAVIDILNRIKL